MRESRWSRRSVLATAAVAGGVSATVTADVSTTATAGVSTAATTSDRAVQTGDADWPMFEFDPANTGYDPTASGVGSIDDQRWRRQGSFRTSSRPVIADGTLYLGTFDDELLAYDLDDGSIETVRRFSTWVDTPAVVGGRVIVGSGEDTYAIDRGSGEIKWARTFDSSASALTYDDRTDRLYRSGRYGVRRLDPETGDVDWFTDMFDGSVYASTPAVGPERVFVNETNEGLHAVNVADGTVEWAAGAEIGNDVAATDGPAVYHDGLVYAMGRWSFESIAEQFSIDNEVVYAVDAATGDVEWVTEVNGVVESPTGVGDRLYVAVGLSDPGTDGQTPGDAKLLGLNATTGAIEWQHRLPDKTVAEDLSVAGGRVYCTARSITFSTDTRTASDHALVAVDPATDERVFEESIPRLSSIVVGDGQVATLSATDSATAVALYEGREPRATPTDRSVSTPSPTESRPTTESTGGGRTATRSGTTPTGGSGSTAPAGTTPAAGFDGFLGQFLAALLGTEALVAISTAVVVVLLVLTWNSRVENG